MFLNRKDAALKLAQALTRYQRQNTIVLGIPRGGVEIAYHVASQLNAEFSIAVTRKLGYPRNPEAAFGAIAEDGSIYISTDVVGVSEKQMDSTVEAEWKEAQRRIKIWRKSRPLPDLTDKTVILVDDGIATGATLFTAISMCHKKKPAKIIVGAPIASENLEVELKKIVDDVVILEKPSDYHAVGQGYVDFQNLTDDETTAFVNAWDNRLKRTL